MRLMSSFVLACDTVYKVGVKTQGENQHPREAEASEAATSVLLFQHLHLGGSNVFFVCSHSGCCSW